VLSVMMVCVWVLCVGSNSDCCTCGGRNHDCSVGVEAAIVAWVCASVVFFLWMCGGRDCCLCVCVEVGIIVCVYRNLKICIGGRCSDGCVCVGIVCRLK